jgi:uncharacterized protein (UPF0128 family)
MEVIIMNRWGYDEPIGNIIGDIKTPAQIFYDGRSQSQKYYSDSQDEAIKEGKKQIEELKAEYTKYNIPLSMSCYPNNKLWEIRIYN